MNIPDFQFTEHFFIPYETIEEFVIDFRRYQISIKLSRKLLLRI